MRLRELLKHIEDKARQIKNINSFSSNDVYETYAKTDIRYSNLSFCPVNATREDNVMRYEFIVYYADRLLVFDHESNKNEIYETSVDIIMSLLNSLDDEIMYDVPLQFTYFEQQFSDYLAGVYASVILEVPYEQGNCELINEQSYTVQFYDYEGGHLLKEEQVIDGGTATPPSEQPTRTGFDFIGWGDPERFENIHENMIFFAEWEAHIFTVNFYIDDKMTEPYNTQQVAYGQSADMSFLIELKEQMLGQDFMGWDTETYTSVSEDLDIHGSWSQWFRLTALADNSSVTCNVASNIWVMQYSYDKQEWSAFSQNSVINLANTGDFVYIRGYRTGTSQSSVTAARIKMTGQIKADGTLMALTMNSSFENRRYIRYWKDGQFKQAGSMGSTIAYQWSHFFYGQTALVDVEQLHIPRISNGAAYTNMLDGTRVKRVYVDCYTRISNDFGYFCDGDSALNRIAFYSWNGTPTTNTQGYWLRNVASKGEFWCTTNFPMRTMSRSSDTIPSGWTIKDFDDRPWKLQVVSE